MNWKGFVRNRSWNYSNVSMEKLRKTTKIFRRSGRDYEPGKL
jgi:hypothetical protein